jgi:predicted DNA binding CopG/RHH family protein
MNTNAKIEGTEDAWEQRELGATEDFVEAVELSAEDQQAIDAALELQPISIRLPKSLIEDFKAIASLSGLGYQPLMRQVLTRFADCEKKRILREVATAAAKKRGEEAEQQDDSAQQDVA